MTSLPDDPDLLKAMLLAERARAERREQIIKAMQRHRFARRAESLPEDQLLLGLEEAEQVEAAAEAQHEQADRAERKSSAAQRRRNRGSLPTHLPRLETIIDGEDPACPCCRNALHRIGEDVSERLDIVPAQLRVLVVRRPKYACRACEALVQAPAPARVIEGGLPTDVLVAQVLVSKYADHLPLYRQAQIYARQGISLDCSTLADWVGRAAWHLWPVHDRLLAQLKTSPRLFADETTAPVLDPGRGQTKTGQLFAYARDDRPWGGTDPPGVAYIYAPDRKAARPIEHLSGFAGVLQVDGYSGYRALAAGNQVTLAFCWAHVRRRFYELATAGAAPIASEALTRIAELYRIESDTSECDQAPTAAAPLLVARVKRKNPIYSHLWSGLAKDLKPEVCFGRCAFCGRCDSRADQRHARSAKRCRFEPEAGYRSNSPSSPRNHQSGSQSMDARGTLCHFHPKAGFPN